MMIGLLGAMEEEVALLRRDLRRARRRTIGGRAYYQGTLYGRPVVLAMSRMGKVASAATASTMITRYGVDLLVFVGVAGAADPRLKIGDIVIADELVQHDLDARPLFPRFEVPLLGRARFPVPKRWANAAHRAATTYVRDRLAAEVRPEVLRGFGIRTPAVRRGLVASGDQFIAGAGRLSGIRRSLPGLLCVEMEGAAVAQVGYEHGVPCVVIRSISDTADHRAHVDFTRFVRDVARGYSRGIVRELLRSFKVND